MPPQLTPEQAKTALDEIWNRFQQPGNKKKLTDLVDECNNAENPMMAKMQKFPAAVTEIVGDLMAALGFQETELMMGVFQIQMHAAKDPDMQHKVGFLMQAFTGNMPSEKSCDAGCCEAEVCD
ncbi:unnamed protein product [Amoebophrya sp. A120]|nr:unnamed protein product [Amoebophrya sp. A120]|eukprot:GSA120T00010217001.1